MKNRESNQYSERLWGGRTGWIGRIIWGVPSDLAFEWWGGQGAARSGHPTAGSGRGSAAAIWEIFSRLERFDG